MNQECHCSHLFYGVHKCSGILGSFELDPGRFIPICQGCQQQITLHDQKFTLTDNLSKTTLGS